MKNKIVIIIVAILVIVGGVVAVMVFTGGGATEADHKQGETTADKVDEVMEKEAEMPESNIDDAAADSLENALGIDEEFDPNDI